MKRIDERDIMFSRMGYEEGSKEYDEYYKNNADKKEIDDELRSLPNIGGEGTATYNPIHSPIVDAGFKFLSDIKKYVDGEVNSKQVEVDPEEMSRKLKKFTEYFGADLVGIVEMKDYHYYSHRGRDKETFGEEITNFHRYGIVFATEMDRDMINRAPQNEEGIEVTKGYIKAAVIGMWLSYYIRELGYTSRNHMDGNYLVVAPLVAEDAGLGEIGRKGILITKKYGPRVRLGVVTTDIPLIADSRNEFGIKEFCKVCKKCVKTCPGKAIPGGDMEVIDGVKRWKIEQEKCYGMWRKLGTDCGVCLSACPFSQGIPGELIDQMKESNTAMEKIIERHEKEHGIRPYIKQPLDLLK